MKAFSCFSPQVKALVLPCNSYLEFPGAFALRRWKPTNPETSILKRTWGLGPVDLEVTKLGSSDLDPRKLLAHPLDALRCRNERDQDDLVLYTVGKTWTCWTNDPGRRSEHVKPKGPLHLALAAGKAQTPDVVDESSGCSCKSSKSKTEHGQSTSPRGRSEAR